jgi:transmembrane sensor
MQKSNQIPEKIQLLIVNFLTESLDQQESQQLGKWISECTENQEAFNSFVYSWYLSGQPFTTTTEKTEEALRKVKSIMDKNKVRSLNTYWSFSRIAVSWIIVFALGALVSFFMTRSLHEPFSRLSKTNVTAPLGSVTLIDLPDGSKVWLNAGSEITYNPSFGQSERNVKLTGEAYFDVKTNKSIPFLVKTSDVIIKAIGTKFNVKAYPDENIITATLEEGKIMLTSLHGPGPKEPVLLKPNEMYTYHKSLGKADEVYNSKADKKNELKIKTEQKLEIIPNIKTELVTSWKDKTWIIESQPLGYLIPILERRYDIKIEFESDEIMKYKFTGKIQKETIEQIMVAFELSAPINYTIEKNKITLSLNKKRQEQYDHFIDE